MPLFRPRVWSPMTIAGCMSGTSCDGIDVAVVEFSEAGLEQRPRVRGSATLPMSRSMSEVFLRVREMGIIGLSTLTQESRALALEHAKAVRLAMADAKLEASDLTAIAVHGQTLYHDPPFSLQLFTPAVLARELDVDVISDFRQADLAAGGQGAPLVPFADHVLFADANETRVLVNLGGIANITLLPAGSPRDAHIRAFDTGPANCLSDWLCRTRSTFAFDHNGALSLRGQVDESLLARVDDSYATKLSPKSTDTPAMIALFAAAMEGHPDRPLEDLLATANMLAARWLARGIAQTDAVARADAIYLAGGGVENAGLMRAIARALPGRTLATTQSLGVASHLREAIAFAILGYATLHGVASNHPSATGAHHAAILGSITPAPRHTDI